MLLLRGWQVIFVVGLIVFLACNDKEGEDDGTTNDNGNISDNGDNGNDGNDGDDNTNKLPQFKIGEEIGGHSLGGKLSLHGCSNADIYTVGGDNVTRDDNGVVEADSTTKNFPTMVVLGVAGEGCKLQHTEAGKSEAQDWATIAETAAGDNQAAWHAVEVRAMTSDQYKVRVTLPSANPVSARVYVSGDGGATAAKQNNIEWDGNEVLTDIEVKDDKLSNALVLVKVGPAGTGSNDKVWWHAYGVSLHEFEIGTVLATDFALAPSDAARKLQVKIAEGGKCGLHLFHLKNANDQWYGEPRRIYTDKYIAIDLAANAKGFITLPIDGGGASHVSGCKVGLNIDGISYMSEGITDSPSRPTFTNMTVTNHNGKVMVTLPPWNNSEVSALNSIKIKASGDGGDSWKTHGAGWDKAGRGMFTFAAAYDVSWHSTAAHNQALVWAKVTINVHKYLFWYYTEGG